VKTDEELTEGAIEEANKVIEGAIEEANKIAACTNLDTNGRTLLNFALAYLREVRYCGSGQKALTANEVFFLTQIGERRNVPIGRPNTVEV
jgi:hypothetical protein